MEVGEGCDYENGIPKHYRRRKRKKSRRNLKEEGTI